MPVPEQEYERPKGAPMWIVTFTDMISLLLTFFIMILTFSSMEEEKMQQATGSLSGAFGVMTVKKPIRTEVDKTLAIKFRERQRDGVTDPSMRKDQVKENLRKIQDRNIFNIKVEAKDLGQKTLLTLTPKGNDELFQLGTDRLMPRTRMLLKEIARMFRTLPVRIAVMPHIDARTPEILGEDPRTVTLGMALAATRILVGEGMIPERVSAQPMGDYFPIADNESPLNRRRNRRMEIMILPGWDDEVARDRGDQDG